MVWFGGRLIVYYQRRKKPTLICTGTAEQQGVGVVMVVAVIVVVVVVVVVPLGERSISTRGKKFKIKSESGKLFAQSLWCLSELHHNSVDSPRLCQKECKKSHYLV
jgi:hypothetical protein